MSVRNWIDRKDSGTTMRLTFIAATFAFGALVSGAPSFAAETGTHSSTHVKADVDPKARELLVEMTQAYQSLRSYAASVEIVAGAGVSMNKSNSKVSYKKPNLAVIFTQSPSGTFKTIADGKAIYITKPGDEKEYERMTTKDAGGVIAMAIRSGGASATGLFPFVAEGSDPFLMLSHNLKSLSVLKSDTAPGLQDATMTIAIGHDDRLIRRVGFLSGDGNAIVETMTDVKVDPKLPNNLFHFTPPAGAKSIPISPS
jgi:outer membrane lipoprotein-sorting protein